MPEAKPKPMRDVPEMDIAVWYDGYEWLQNNGEVAAMYLRQVYEAIGRGYTPDEIYYYVLKKAGIHRPEIAERCRAAANWILYTSAE